MEYMPPPPQLIGSPIPVPWGRLGSEALTLPESPASPESPAGERPRHFCLHTLERRLGTVWYSVLDPVGPWQFGEGHWPLMW